MATHHFKIKDLVDLTNISDKIGFDINPLLDLIGISDIDLLQIPQSFDPAEVISEPTLSEEEAFELLEDFQDELEEIAPDIDIPQPQIDVEKLEEGKLKFTYELAVLSNLELDLENEIGVTLVFNEGGFQADLLVDGTNFEFSTEVSLGIKLSNSLFKPMKKTENNGQVSFEEDPDRTHIQIDLASVAIKVDQDGKISFDENFSFDLGGPVGIGGTDIVVEGSGAALNLSGDGKKPDGAADDWKGLFVKNIKVYLTKVLQKPLTASDMGIGTGGFSGKLEGTFPLDFDANSDPKFTGALSAGIFGLEGGLSFVKLAFENNIPETGELNGQLLLPFLDEPADVEIELEADGGFNATISGLNQLTDIHISDECIAAKWVGDIQTIAQQAAPGMLDNLKGQNVNTAMRIIRGDGFKIEEIRVDWDISGNPQTFEIPGLAFTTPADLMLSLVMQNESDNGQLPNKARLVTTLDTDAEVKGMSSFAWTRDDDREIHNDENYEPAEGETIVPLLELSVKAEEKVSLALLSFDLKELKLPTFFKQYDAPLEELDFSDDVALCTPLPAEVVKLDGDSWDVDFKFNVENDQFKLPFLRNNDDDNNDTGGISQFLDVNKGDEGIDIDFGASTVTCPIDILVKFGKIEFETGVGISFNWESFAFGINHSGGIDLVSSNEEEAFNEFLGLNWRFKGKDIGDGKFHHFTIVTDRYNYQIKQADGAVLELDFTKASKDPITFAVSDFAISPKGISITSEVKDTPAQLNGINTKFRFEGSKLEIVENKIKAFTLSGSGPLPPDLVGDAMADVSLQFGEREGKLTLLEGGAQLRGEKLLDAKNTRFQFQIDAIGLKFVNDGGYHLYFTLTGSAAFVLAPGDDSDGALGLLPKIKVDFIECPLTGDMSVLAKHISFNIELPKPISFKFLGAFEMEIRGIGFLPQAEVFGGDASMLMSGQVYFSLGGDDTKSAKFDFHGLYIGVPKKGSFFPRINMEKLGLEIKVGSAFELSGVVSFLDTDQQKGFAGEGRITIKGMPTVSATFAFLRARKDANGAWLRAWFLYLEVGKISLEIPVIKLHIREIGLGFGYRYTLTSIKAADETNDVGLLIQKLDELSKTQGNLSKLDAWALDLEDRGETPRWTIVFRAMISQTTLSSPLKYNESGEKDLACTFLFDAVIAFRSDLTFLMAIRVWLNTNYNDFLTNDDVKNRPLLSGYVLLSVRQKRFLARIASNPDGLIGEHPPFPDFIKTAITNSRFSITLLIEPGLFHYEMGWPNKLGWKGDLGPLQVDITGGFIFRVSKSEMVIGQSFMARGKLEIDSGVDLGIVGVRVHALATVAYGARYIGVIFFDTSKGFAFHGAIGLELMVKFSVSFWIKIKLGFFKVKISIGFSLHIGFTAGLEVGLDGAKPGLRGRATISVGALGKSVRLKINISLGEENVDAALAKTQKFLDIGLVASDAAVEPVPGTGASAGLAAPAAAASVAAPPPTVAARSVARNGATEAIAFESVSAMEALTAPGYIVFVIRNKSADGKCYFVLIPQGESDTGQGEEKGFLPVPPAINEEGEMLATPANDFSLHLPDGFDDYTLEQYNPFTGNFEERTDQDFSWQVNWNAALASEADLDSGAIEELPSEEEGNPSPEDILKEFLLYKYLRNAFVDDGTGELSDPDLFPTRQGVEDIRVHNPSENAFEAAVKGAFEQFKGSPFFRNDRTNEYEQLLQQAFDDRENIYATTNDGTTLAEEALTQREQADQLRGMITQNIITDLKDYVAELEKDNPVFDFVDKSYGFQMGLVFRVGEDELPEWLSEIVPDGEHPTIQQRTEQTANTPNSEFRPVRTFNVSPTDFSINAPQFERVVQYTDAGTVAITWDLVWKEVPDENCTACQAEPEHHLLHYRIRRRALDNSEPEAIFTVKNAEALCLENDDSGNKVLKALQPRFKLVDHFENETQEDLANLPESGKSYLYTITPVDFAGNIGRPISLVATRFPNVPPQVPASSELTVLYKLDTETILAPENAEVASTAIAVSPEKLKITWEEPLPPKEGPDVPIKTYRLIFRKEEILPIGSYGLDGEAMGPVHKKLPTSNARPLPSDKKIVLQQSGLRTERSAEITVAELKAAGIFPSDDAQLWRPEAWNVYFQTISINGVPSGLAPVQLLLRVESLDPEADNEERRPANLEWLPEPLKFNLLPPEDQSAETGNAHFPMPKEGSFSFNGSASDSLHQLHPAGVRAIRFRWNQGPSSQLNYPIRLNAGFEILQLDVDAFTTEVFENQEKLGDALQDIQEVQMVPADDLLFIPGDTLTTSQWEAWYPSSILRLRDPDSLDVEGSESPFGPWYSSRESILVWPERDNYARLEPAEWVHPFLEDLLVFIETQGEGLGYVVDRQIPPPIQPGTVDDFFTNTAPGADFYGWGILQRFGLTSTISIRDANDGRVIQGAELMDLVKLAIDAQADDVGLKKHLFVELLFQQGKSVAFKTIETEAESLLGIIQISLRPVFQQKYQYQQLELDGPPNAEVNIQMPLNAGDACTFIDQSNPGSGEIQLTADVPENVTANVLLPIDGISRLILRCKDQLPDYALAFTLGGDYSAIPIPADLSSFVSIDDSSGVAKLLVKPALYLEANAANLLSQMSDFLEEEDQFILDFRVLKNESFLPTNERSIYFTTPPDLAAVLTDSQPGEKSQWEIFKCYAESFNSNNADDPKISIPTSGDEFIEFLPKYLIWSQRFFDYSGEPVVQNDLGEVTGENWLATAYPRAGSPAFASPDKSHRLKYDHLLEDPWAHNYRYYFRPYGRYDLLWQSFRQSPSLFPDTDQAFDILPKALPEPDSAALDVVLDRTKSISAPIILSSTRLDEPSTTAQPALPGHIWEVIVAQHPEQALIERNQSLYRRLSFRQVAYSLLRRFALRTLPDDLVAAVNFHDSDLNYPPIEIELVENHMGEIPSTLPDRPVHLDLDNLSEHDELSLNIPSRIGKFNQNALVLQWEGLPFFYEQKLLLIAQSASTVSRVNSIVQQDFHYQTPVPVAILQTLATNDGRRPQILIPLKRLWDALDETAQRHWIAEEPLPKDSPLTARKYASLPDLEVVYQIVELFTGNIEVQTEYFFSKILDEDGNTTKTCYEGRQLAERFISNIETIIPPTSQPQDDFYLALEFDVTPTEVNILRNYRRSDILQPTRKKIKIENSDNLLTLTGLFTKEDIDNILWNANSDFNNLKVEFDPNLNDDTPPSERNAVLAEWYSLRSLKEVPDLDVLSPTLRAKIDFPCVPVLTDFWHILQSQITLAPFAIHWKGPLSPAQAVALEAFNLEEHKICLDSAREAVLQILFAQQASAEFTAPYEAITDPLPGQEMPDQLDITIAPGANQETNWSLHWKGQMNDVSKTQLLALSEEPNFVTAANALINNYEEHSDTVGIQARDFTPPELPQFSIEIVEVVGATAVWNMTWKGPMTTAQADELTAISDDTIWLTGIAGLIGLVNEFYTDYQHTEIAIMPYPVFDMQHLTDETGVDFTGISFSPNLDSILWERSCVTEIPIEDIRNRVVSCLNPIDPLNASIENVLQQIETKEVSVELDFPQLIRCTTFLTEAEREALMDATNHDEDRDAIIDLYEDLKDKNSLVAAQNSFNCSDRVSLKPFNIPLDEDGNPIATFEDATDCQLILKSINPEISTALDALDGDSNFINAIEALKAKANENSEAFTKVNLTAGPAQIPPALIGHWDFTVNAENSHYETVSWNGIMTDEQKLALQIWANFDEFLVAANTIMDQLNAVEIQVEMSRWIPTALVGKLQIETKEVAWVGIPPNQEELAELTSLKDNPSTHSALSAALNTLIQNLDAADLPSVVRANIDDASFAVRPIQAALPADLQSRMTIGDTSLTWTGAQMTESQKTALKQVETTGDTAFINAVKNLIDQLENQQISAEFTVSVRPDQSNLPSILQDQLLIGKVKVHYTGWMTEEEGKALRLIFESPANKDAIERLFEASQSKWISNRDIRIRTRRGSAAPSEMIPFIYPSID